MLERSFLEMFPVRALIDTFFKEGIGFVASFYSGERMLELEDAARC